MSFLLEQMYLVGVRSLMRWLRVLHDNNHLSRSFIREMRILCE